MNPTLSRRSRNYYTELDRDTNVHRRWTCTTWIVFSVVFVPCDPISDNNIRYRGRKFIIIIIITYFVETKLKIKLILVCFCLSCIFPVSLYLCIHLCACFFTNLPCVLAWMSINWIELNGMELYYQYIQEQSVSLTIPYFRIFSTIRALCYWMWFCLWVVIWCIYVVFSVKQALLGVVQHVGVKGLYWIELNCWTHLLFIYIFKRACHWHKIQSIL